MPTILSRKSVHLTDEQSQIVNEFFAKFPTEQDCIEEICKQIEPKSCPLCGGDQLVREFGSRIIYCRSCRGKTYCTGDSFFHRLRKIQAMLACIFFYQKGFCIPSTKLAELFGVTTATAQRIIKKVSHVLKEQMKIELPKIASAEFLPIFGKRSTETPARKPPRYEQKIIEDELKQSEPPPQEYQSSSESNQSDSSNDNEPLSSVMFSSADLDGSILNHISDEPKTFDELLSLNLKSASELSSLLGIFEIEGLVKALPGGKYVRFKPTKDQVFFLSLADESESNSDKTALIMLFIRSNFGGCSRKYLDLFLSMYWCFRDRARWGPGEVLRACLDYGYISFKSIYSNVTPLLTNFCPF